MLAVVVVVVVGVGVGGGGGGGWSAPIAVPAATSSEDDGEVVF